MKQGRRRCLRPLLLAGLMIALAFADGCRDRGAVPVAPEQASSFMGAGLLR